MKKVLFAILSSMLFVSVTQADLSREAPQCYNDAGVDEKSPYILTVQNINPYALGLFLEDLTADGLLKVENTINFDPAHVLVLSVDPSKILVAAVVGIDHAAAVNQAVAQKVKAVGKKYKLSKNNLILECNGIVQGYPRAGGMN